VLATNVVWQIVNWAGFWQLLTVVVSFVASLLAARIGGHIAGKYALKAQGQAALDQRERDREIEQQALAGTLRAIRAELLVLRADCLQPLWNRLKAAVPGPFPTMPVQENFFIVYESNAGLIGKIDNQTLLTTIVSVYGQAKGLNDAMNFNHLRCSTWINLQAAQQADKRTTSVEQFANIEQELTLIRAGIDRGLGLLLEDSQKLCAQIEAHLVSQKKQ
jgi:hypothetical protein